MPKDDHQIQTKLNYEKQKYKSEHLVSLDVLDGIEFCKWRDLHSKLQGYLETEILFSRVIPIDAQATFGRQNKQNYIAELISNISKLDNIWKKRSVMLRDLRSRFNTFNKSMEDLNFTFVLSNIDECTESLLKKEIADKAFSLKSALDSMNYMLLIYRKMRAEFEEGQDTSTIFAEEKFEPWNSESFNSALDSLQELVSKIRQDKNQLEETRMQMRSISKENIDAVLHEAGKNFQKDGDYRYYDQDYFLWVKGIGISLAYYNREFEERFEIATDLFEDVFELLFIKDRLFPFLLTETYRITNQQDTSEYSSFSGNSPWEMINRLSSGMRFRLEILEGRLYNRWPRGLRIVHELKENELKIKRATSYMWGKSCSIKLQNSLSQRIQDAKQSIVRCTREGIQSIKQINSLSSEISSIKRVFKVNNKLMLRYSQFNSDKMDAMIVEIQGLYEALCFTLSDLRETSEIHDPLEMDKKGLKDLKKLAEDQSNLNQEDQLISQALLPEKNGYFIDQEIDKVIDAERYSQYPNHVKIGYYSSLKFVLSNFQLFERIYQWFKAVSDSLKTLNIEITEFASKNIKSVFRELLRYDHEVSVFIDELESHVSLVEELIASSKMDNVVINAVT